MEKREPSCTVGGNMSWYSHYGEEYGDTLEIYTENYHMTQQSHSWECIRTKLTLKKTHVGVPVVTQWLTNLTRNPEVAGSGPALAQWVKDPALP